MGKAGAAGGRRIRQLSVCLVYFLLMPLQGAVADGEPRDAGVPMAKSLAQLTVK
jgi:hypothetical protein